MNDKFFDLKQEKQDRIINGALKIFARNSYKHTSTDVIVKEAGISKGLLFHYFTSKLGLYEFLYQYSVRFMLLEISREVKRRETNFFILRKQMEKARMQVMKMYPYMQQFLIMADREENAEAVALIEEIRSDYRMKMQDYMAQVDYSAFRHIEEEDRLVKLVDYVITGLTEDLSGRFDFTPEKLYEEICSYLDMLEKMM